MLSSTSLTFFCCAIGSSWSACGASPLNACPPCEPRQMFFVWAPEQARLMLLVHRDRRALDRRDVGAVAAVRVRASVHAGRVVAAEDPERAACGAVGPVPGAEDVEAVAVPAAGLSGEKLSPSATIAVVDDAGPAWAVGAAANVTAASASAKAKTFDLVIRAPSPYVLPGRPTRAPRAADPNRHVGPDKGGRRRPARRHTDLGGADHAGVADIEAL